MKARPVVGLCKSKLTVSRRKSIEINPEAINPDDLAELSDLVVAAVNMALTDSKETSQTEMRKITGGLSLPGLF